MKRMLLVFVSVLMLCSPAKASMAGMFDYVDQMEVDDWTYYFYDPNCIGDEAYEYALNSLVC